MTEYEILTNLPRTHYFGDWDKKDIRAFGKWFMAVKTTVCKCFLMKFIVIRNLQIGSLIFLLSL